MEEQAQSPGPLMVGKVLVGALMMGVGSATGVMFALVHFRQHSPTPGMEVLLLVTAGFWPISAAAAYVVGRAMTAKARADWNSSDGRGDETDLAQPYLGMVIVRAALVEGSGLLGAVTFLLTGNMLALIAPALSLAALGLLFPTEDKLQAFVRDVTGGR